MNQADTAWMLISTALVLFMASARAFFYGGLARSTNALDTMMMSVISLGFVASAIDDGVSNGTAAPAFLPARADV